MFLFYIISQTTIDPKRKIDGHGGDRSDILERIFEPETG
jgi:hypothetical protein